MGRVFQGSWETLPAESMEGEGSATRTSKALRCMGMIKCHTIVHGTCIIVVWLGIISIAQVRFVVKYRHCDGSLVLKITDDKVVSMKLAYGYLVSSPDLIQRVYRPLVILKAIWRPGGMKDHIGYPALLHVIMTLSILCPLPPNQAIVGQGGDLKRQWPL